MTDSRKQIFLKHFEHLAPTYTKYKKRFAYYWNDIVNYINYFLTNEQSILDIGCGTGDSLSKLKGNRKLGIDFSPEMIKKAKLQYPDIDFKLMDAEQLQLKEKFDNIIISNTIGYIDNIQDLFTSLQKVCKRNTRIIISYYSQFWEPFLRFGEFVGIKKKSPRQNWLSIKDMKNLLYLSGFDTYRVTRRILFPIKIPFISFLINKIIGRLPIFNSLSINYFVFARPEIKTIEEYTVSVAIPARNESGNIENALVRMPNFGKHLEIIFIEGNSTDETWETIQRISKKYSELFDIKIARQDGKGKGDAVRKAYDIATGDILMILDADLTVPPEELPKFYKALVHSKGEFINGSRLVYQMDKHAMRPLNVLGNKFFSMAFSWILEQPIKDTLCGTKVMFRKDYIRLTKNRNFFGDFDPFGDFDLIFGAYKLNLKIIDLPIVYKERIYGDTNISRFRHGFILLKMMVFAIGKIKFR